MSDLIDFELSEYIDSTFTPEAADDIYTAFELLYSFQMEDVETDFINLITLDSYLSKEDTQDQFIILLHSKLDDVINQHKLTLNDNVSLSIKVELLSVLLSIMYLEDYSFIATVLESDLSDIEILATIVEEYSTLKDFDILTSISEIDPIFFNRLKEFIYSKEDIVILDIEDSNTEAINNIKLLYEFINKETLGYQLVKDGISPNLTIEQYLAIIDDSNYFNNIKDIDTLSLNIFSLLLISQNSLNGLLLIYRKNNHLLLDNINTIAQVESKLIQLLSNFLDFKKAKQEGLKHDQNRIS